jgi:predicted kinase
MPSVVLLCGLPFAGKTTVAAQLREQLGATVISLDAINAERGLFGGEGIAIEEWRRTHEIAMVRLAAALEMSTAIVVIDDTNCLRFLRDDYRAVAWRYEAETHVVLVRASMEEVVPRLRNNRVSATRNDVRDDVLAATVDRFEWPGDDERPIVWRGVRDLRERLETCGG